MQITSIKREEGKDATKQDNKSLVMKQNHFSLFYTSLKVLFLESRSSIIFINNRQNLNTYWTERTNACRCKYLLVFLIFFLLLLLVTLTHPFPDVWGTQGSHLSVWLSIHPPPSSDWEFIYFSLCCVLIAAHSLSRLQFTSLASRWAVWDSTIHLKVNMKKHCAKHLSFERTNLNKCVTSHLLYLSDAGPAQVYSRP